MAICRANPGLLSLEDLSVKSSDAGLGNYWVRIQILCEVRENLTKKLLKETGQIQYFVKIDILKLLLVLS